MDADNAAPEFLATDASGALNMRSISVISEA